MTEANAIKAADALQVAYSESTKLLCFIGNAKREAMYHKTLIVALDDCANALGYELVAQRTK